MAAARVEGGRLRRDRVVAIIGAVALGVDGDAIQCDGKPANVASHIRRGGGDLGVGRDRVAVLLFQREREGRERDEEG